MRSAHSLFRLALPSLSLSLALFTACGQKSEQSAYAQRFESIEENAPDIAEKPTPETSVKETALLSPTAIDKETCGLPEEIREPDWPLELKELSNKEPQPLEQGASTIAIIPDTQYYVSCREPHFKKQIEWLRSQTKSRRIKAAIHLGDLTEHNTKEEWLFVRDALSPLVGHLPLLLATGNHDYGDGGTANRRSTLFDEYFFPSASPTSRALAARMTPGSRENVYYRFSLLEEILGVMILEWSPGTQSVAWAKKVFETFPGDRVIFVTHAYLYHDETRYNFEEKATKQKWNPRSYGTAKSNPQLPGSPDNWHPHGAYDGEMLWNELLKDHPGLFLTLNGHVLGDGAGVLTSTGTHGNKVHQTLVNYQMLREGGLGYLRLIEFSGNGQKLKMKTYSPSLNKYSLASDQNFSLSLSPPLRTKSRGGLVLPR